ncbi:MarR family winged helix-turn-helix transcriptional regulator [Marinibaculum pumilum]|uniref:MarR family winged helix-turn-helix transcriptional regulator n=1 Tax=Marinibaculum pumilum TaxID=1766165 RepID=A0ABV7KVV3_9PROT
MTRQGRGTGGGAAEAPSAGDAPPAQDLRFRIVNWIGIIDQLAGARANTLLAPLDLTLPQFALLNHFSWRGEAGLTVGAVARAMQQPQPGITKTLQKLEDRGFLWSVPNPVDGRSRLLHMSEAGRTAHLAAVEVLGRALAAPFADWTPEELDLCFRLLDRLKVWFDANR